MRSACCRQDARSSRPSGHGCDGLVPLSRGPCPLRPMVVRRGSLAGSMALSKGPTSCPSCRKPLGKSSTEDSRGDQCRHCGGLWIPRPALVELLRQHLSREGLPSQIVALQERPLASPRGSCPHCVDTELERISFRGVHVEQCPACRGVFLDHGEAELLLRRVKLAVGQWRRGKPKLPLGSGLGGLVRRPRYKVDTLLDILKSMPISPC